MNATDLLVLQHQTIQRLIERLASDGANRAGLLLELIEELLVHIAVEEEIFYPASQRAIDVSLRVHRAQHRRAKDIILHMATFGVDGRDFTEKLAELDEIVREHVDLEERGLLPEAAREMSAPQLHGLAARMHVLRASLTHPEKCKVSLDTDGPGRHLS